MGGKLTREPNEQKNADLVSNWYSGHNDPCISACHLYTFSEMSASPVQVPDSGSVVLSRALGSMTALAQALTDAGALAANSVMQGRVLQECAAAALLGAEKVRIIVGVMFSRDFPIVRTPVFSSAPTVGSRCIRSQGIRLTRGTACELVKNLGLSPVDRVNLTAACRPSTPCLLCDSPSSASPMCRMPSSPLTRQMA